MDKQNKSSNELQGFKVATELPNIDEGTGFLS